MTLRTGLFAAVLLAASTTLAAQARNIDVRLRGYEHLVRLDTLAVWTVIPATPANAYVAAQFVFDALQMPLTTADSVGGLLYQSGFNTRRKVLGKRMSWAVKCGDGITGDNADSWRIHMAYAVFLEPAPDNQTRMGVTLAAGANNVDGAYKPAVGCGSTGAFEAEIAMLVRAQAQLK